MLIEVIASSLSTIASITALLQNRRPIEQANIEYLGEIRARVLNLEMEISKIRQSGAPVSDLFASYNRLLEVIRSSGSYSSRLEFRPTSHGTWLLVRRKPTVLRDPEGEYLED
jgi:hypothetical protein